MKLPRLLGIGFITGLFLVSCTPRSERSPLQSPLLPILLSLDSTEVFLDDFFGQTSQIDSVFYNTKKLTPLSVTNSKNGKVIIRSQPSNGLGLLTLWSINDHWNIPVFPCETQEITYRLQGWDGIQSMHLKGDLNGWSSTATPLSFDGEGWTCSLQLPRGKHPYRLMMDGIERTDPNNPNIAPNGFGGFNSILQVGEDVLHLPISIQKVGEKTRTTRFEVTTSPNALLHVFWDSKVVAQLITDSNGFASFGIPAIAFKKERSDIQLWAHKDEQRSQEIRVPLRFGAPILRAENLPRNDPHAMVMYFLMIDRFANGNIGNDLPTADPGIHPRAQYYGGDFAGIQNHLPYLDSLGVNTVWVSPISPNPPDAWGLWTDSSTPITSKFSAYHGYWPIQSSGTDARFGSFEEFNTLVDEIHASNMNILVDYVANHVHQDHLVYQMHPDWATPLYLADGTLNTQLWDDQRLTTWFDTFMPTLDFERSEVVDAMTDSAMWWVEHSAIDGFRHDATKHIPAGFWRALTAKIKAFESTQNKPALFQIGETYGSPELISQYISDGMLDAQFDFNLYDALVTALANPNGSLSSLLEEANQSLHVYGAHHLMGNISGNQDRPRFASLADGSLSLEEDSKLAGWTRDIQHQGDEGYIRMNYLMAFIMSTPGIPCIYYGDEIADVGGNDPDNRRMMRFDHWNDLEQSTWQNTRDWIQLRRKRMSLLFGQTTYLEIRPGVLQIRRQYLDEETMVIINTSNESITPKNLPANYTLLLGKTEGEMGEKGVPGMSSAAFGN
jgi:glycosidase